MQVSEDGENDKFLYGVCAMQGWRTEMVRGLPLSSQLCQRCCFYEASACAASTSNLTRVDPVLATSASG
jgi:hypothetical protein